jgi:hypothetical protein
MHSYLINLLFLLLLESSPTPKCLDLILSDPVGMHINWKSINATGVISARGGTYSLYGCISQSPVGIIQYMGNTLSPYGIISGFWSSECDVTLNSIQGGKDFFTLPNDKLVFKLYPNFPNPFKKTTKIKYDIPITSKVNLFIYDICGRQIKQLVNEKQDIGQYIVNWNGKDENGKECSAGVYFISMKTENYKSIKKVLITK